jgi:lipid-A-disaccharide synthase
LTARVLLSCGEPSGDLYAGALVRELASVLPGVQVTGLGGPELAAAGGHLLEDYRGLAVTGLTEAIVKIPRSIGLLRRLAAFARRERPDVAVVVDFPDFNLPLARRLKRLGLRVVYYVSPQIWAWRPGRLQAIRAVADRVLVIFPFEESIYREAGVPVEFVGHPLAELARASVPRAPFLQRLGLDASAPTVAVLPGSRANEVARILPDLMRACALVQRDVAGAQVVVARAPGLEDRLFQPVEALKLPRTAVVEGDTDGVLAAADVVLTASGTATVQAAIHDVPMVVVYRLSPLTYRLGRRLVLVDTFGMVNLIAGERLVPELIQDAFTPAAVAAEAVSLLTDADRASRIRAGLARVRARLGPPGASRRAAEAVAQVAAQARAQTGARGRS